MLIEYFCKNFRSIGEEIHFSMLSSSDNSNPNNLIKCKDYNVLKEAVFYGANGSGKTNFVKSISLLKSLVLNGVSLLPGMQLFTNMHKLFLNDNTEFKIQFTSRNNIRYAYGLTYNKNEVVEEYLYFFPNGRKAKIFDRTKEEISFGLKYETDLSRVVKDFLKPNRVMLSCATSYSNIEEIKDAFLFFSDDLVIYSGNENLVLDNWSLYSAEVSSKNSDLMERFVSFYKSIGSTDVKSISSKVEDIKIDEKQIPIFISEDLKKQLLNSPSKTSTVIFNYDKFSLNLNEESLGVQKLFNMFFPLVDIIDKGKVFLVDEFERHLHPLIVLSIIETFNKNKTNAQLIFTTHDVNFLNLKLFRRDQIWFTELKVDTRSTILYSLAELKAIRKDESIDKNYQLGKYSAIPIISASIEDALIREVKGE